MIGRSFHLQLLEFIMRWLAFGELEVSMRRPRVLLADDHTLLLEAFEKLLEDECDVVGTVADGRALLDAAPKLRPDVIVMDISMPLLNGLDAARKLKHMMPRVKLIFLTVNKDPDIAAEAFRLGASGYLLKNSAASELIEAIRQVLKDKAYVTPLMTRGMVKSLQRPQRDKASNRLTTRQWEPPRRFMSQYSPSKYFPFTFLMTT